MRTTDKEIEAKINEFGDLSDEIDRMKAKLAKLQKKFKSVDNDLKPILEELNETEQVALQTDKYLISIKKKGYERSSPKYKDAFNLALTKVNKATQKVLNDAFEATKGTSTIATQLGVQSITTEVDLGRVMRTFKRFLKLKFRSLQKSNDDLMSATNQLKKLDLLLK